MSQNQKRPLNPQKREQPAQVTSVAHGRLRKKSLGTKVKETFLTTDLPDVKTDIVGGIIVPQAKTMVLDALRSITGGLLGTAELLLFGKISNRSSMYGRERPGPLGSSITSRIRYESMYNKTPKRELSYAQRSTFAIDSIEFYGEEEGEDHIIRDAKHQAQYVIECMRDRIEIYGSASVKDLYDYAGITGDYTEDDWGWKDFSTARPEPISGGGYIIVCPKPTYLGAR